MWWPLFCVFITILVQNVVCFDQHHILCANNTQQRATRACTTQILDQESPDILDSCLVEYFPSNSAECKSMSFGDIASNAQIGRVGLEPYILQKERYGHNGNYTVLNITFSDIRWKTMKFRFQLSNKQKHGNHCRNILLSDDVPITDQSVLYYDCYWSITDGNYGQSHVLDFEATDGKVVNRGQYHFNIPSAHMLSSTVTADQWVPFVYLEILMGTMKLHIMPPPQHLNITAYEIKVMKEADKGPEVVRQTIEKLKNSTQEVTSDYSLLYNGSYYFVVTPLHSQCYSQGQGCLSVDSPKMTIRSDGQNMNICIASIMAVVVASLFAYYVLLKLINRYWCKDYTRTPDNDLQIPTKALVVYAPSSPQHAECVDSFVNLLRNDYGLDVMYDLDISKTEHKDPFQWATKSFDSATHVIYIVSPPEQVNNKNNCDKPLMNPYKNLDILYSAQLENNAGSKNRKKILYVFFGHSDKKLPTQSFLGKSFYLTKDWNKMIAYLSKNQLPKQDISRTEKGQAFLSHFKTGNHFKTGSNKCYMDGMLYSTETK